MYLWQKTNEDYLGDMWRDVVDFTPARILQLYLQGETQTTQIEERGQGQYSLEKRKMRGLELERLGGQILANVEDQVVSDNPKGNDYRVPVNIFNRKEQGENNTNVENTLELPQMGMLRWWKRQLTQE